MGELAKLADDVDAALRRIATRLTNPEAAAFGRTSGTLRRLDREDGSSRDLFFRDLGVGDRFQLVSYPNVRGTKTNDINFTDTNGIGRIIASTGAAVRRLGSTCRHCSRAIVLDGDVWVDPEATGDDSV